jgi:hypothetical protein
MRAATSFWQTLDEIGLRNLSTMKGVTTMSKNSFPKWSAVVLTILATIAFLPMTVSSHYDTMNGPVVTAAKKALETGNVNLVLIWVQKKDEAEITKAFQKTLAVRKLNPEAQQLADMYFFETLVRIHRAGEGEPYTGIKPAGTEVESGIEAADKALELGSLDELIRHLDEAIHQGINARFQQVLAKKQFKPDNVEAGREYVKAYVQFIHYVQNLYQTANKPAEEHHHEEGE